MVSRIATIAASAFLTLACASQERSNTEVKAEVRLAGTASGTVTLTQKKYTANTVFSGSFEKVPPGKHGIRVSEGNNTFNPFSKKHGGPWQPERAVGDLGNVEADASGNILWNHSDPYVKLSGPFSIVGKNLTLHEKEDDFGLGNLLFQEEMKEAQRMEMLDLQFLQEIQWEFDLKTKLQNLLIVQVHLIIQFSFFIRMH